MSSRLQAVREGLGLSRAKVAAKIGSSEKQLERWEKGRTPVKHWHLVALAAVYEVPPDALVDEAEREEVEA